MAEIDKILFDIRAAKELLSPGIKRQEGNSVEVAFVTDSVKILALMERLALEVHRQRYGNPDE